MRTTEGISPQGEPPSEGEVVNPRGGGPRESRRGEAPVVNPKDDSPRENRRAKRGGDANRHSASENHQAEGLVVNWGALLARAGCDRSVIAHARA
ncbi:MAG TPA: hypothetical protein VK450_03285, partial [Methanomicrobiales archaeon]|nr:hypothetical protein [Methanomicrobiales archaeon]